MWGILQEQQLGFYNEPTRDTPQSLSHTAVTSPRRPPSRLQLLTLSTTVTTHPHHILYLPCIYFAFSCPQRFAGQILQLWIPFPTSSCNLDIGQLHVTDIPMEVCWSQNTPVLWSLISDVYHPSGWTDSWSLSFHTSGIFPPPFSPISVLEIFCKVKQISGFLIKGQ